MATPAPEQQARKSVPNSVSHRQSYFERLAAGKVQTNPPPRPTTAATIPQQPLSPAPSRKDREAALAKLPTLAEQMASAEKRTAATGVVSVTKAQPSVPSRGNMQETVVTPNDPPQVAKPQAPQGDPLGAQTIRPADPGDPLA